jgi:hypothetical protein
MHRIEFDYHQHPKQQPPHDQNLIQAHGLFPHQMVNILIKVPCKSQMVTGKRNFHY